MSRQLNTCGAVQKAVTCPRNDICVFLFGAANDPAACGRPPTELNGKSWNNPWKKKMFSPFLSFSFFLANNDRPETALLERRRRRGAVLSEKNNRPRAARSLSSRVEWKSWNMVHTDRLSMWRREDAKCSKKDVYYNNPSKKDVSYKNPAKYFLKDFYVIRCNQFINAQATRDLKGSEREPGQSAAGNVL